jgi:hypothetical protein
MNELRIFGKIFLPETPNEVLNGVWLNIKRGSIYLEISHNTLANQKWQIILGEFNGLDQVTFVNSHAGGGSSGSGGTWRKIHVSYLIKDCHINRYSDLLFTKISLNSPTLSNWVNEPDGIDRIDDYTYKIPQKKEIFSILISDLKISLLFTHSLEHSSKSLKVERKCIFEITTLGSIHISVFSKLMTKIKKWILFVTNKNPEFSSYYLTSNETESIELVNTLEDLNEGRFTQNISLSFHDLKQSLKSVFENWMQIENLDTIVGLLQEKHYNTDMTFQSYFLNMCVAIESFHYIYIKENKDEKIENRKKDRDTILALIEDQELKMRFSKLSQRWDESTYRERLKSFKPAIEIIMGNTFKFTFSKMVNKIVDTRNSLAHKGTYDGQLKHIELLLIGKVIEFTLKFEVFKLLKYFPERENDFLENAKRHLEILAALNEYGATTT